jgi:hypothetical protein
MSHELLHVFKHAEGQCFVDGRKVVEEFRERSAMFQIVECTPGILRSMPQPLPIFEGGRSLSRGGGVDSMCSNIASPQSLTIELVTGNARDIPFSIAQIFLRTLWDI